MGTKISIITFNVFGVPFNGNKIIKSLFRTRIRKRFRAIGKLLNDSKADIICLQEVYTIPHLNILKETLAKYPYCYYKLFLLSPRGGVITFSKFPMETVEYADFIEGGKWHNKSVVGKISKRGLLITKLKEHPYYIINTHLTQNSDHDWSENNRYIPMLKSQLDEVIKATALLIKNNIVILAGDFNMPKKSEIYQQFIRTSSLFDIFNEHEIPTARNIPILDSKNIGRIDYIFITKNATLKKVSEKHIFTKKVAITPNEKIYLSDHIGLQVDLELTSKLKSENKN